MGRKSKGKKVYRCINTHIIETEIVQRLKRIIKTKISYNKYLML